MSVHIFPAHNNSLATPDVILLLPRSDARAYVSAFSRQGVQTIGEDKVQ